MYDIEKRARELLAYECPECGGENGHETEDGWLRCSRCANPHDVTRHQAMQAIIAALMPPDGYVLVPADSVKHCACGCGRYCCTHCGTELGGFLARPEAP